MFNHCPIRLVYLLIEDHPIWHSVSEAGRDREKVISKSVMSDSLQREKERERGETFAFFLPLNDEVKGYRSSATLRACVYNHQDCVCVDAHLSSSFRKSGK